MSDYFPGRANELTVLGENGNVVARVDPIGGLRLRSSGGEDVLAAVLDEQGYTLRSVDSGLVTAEITPGNFRLVDPVGVDDIEMVTASSGTLPNPAYRSSVAASPGSSLSFPSAPVFTSTPADDIEIGHVAAWIRATNQSATMTPPTSWTEQLDGNIADAAGTLQTSVATRDPAVGAAGTFTSTQSNWQHRVGTHVVIKGGGATSPSFRALSTAQLITTDSAATLTIDKPTGTADTDALVVFVSLGTSGGGVPGGWSTPAGFVFLGAGFSMSSSGSTQTSVAAGVWAKLAGGSEPASYETSIKLPTGTKVIHAAMVAIQAPTLVPGGVQIRMAGHPIRRLLAFTELTSASGTLCDFQSIPQGYDNLELVIDSNASAAGSDTRMFLRFNGNTTGNVQSRLSELHSFTTNQQVNQQTVRLGAVSGAASAQSSASLHIYGYTKLRRRVVLGRAYWADVSAVMRDDQIIGQWDNTTDAITRVAVESAKNFGVGSRAYLYGY